MLVYAVVEDALSPDFPLGEAIETFVRREDAERFIEEVRGDDPVPASYLRIEERGLERGIPGSSLGKNRYPVVVQRGLRSAFRDNSYASVAATLALVFSLTGTAAATSITLFTGQQVKDGTLGR